MPREYERGEYLDRQYLVLDRFRGNMGVVYAARDRVTNVTFAIKSPLPARCGDQAFLLRFRRESQAWVSLGHHDHIVQAYLYREIEGVPFLFLEYVRGAALAEFLAPRAPLHVPQALAWGLQIARAMDFVHSVRVGGNYTGILHRDIKPANILIDARGRAKITDFGLSRLGAHAEAEGGFAGTPRYAAPEQIEGEELDSRTDIYAIGVVLYEMLCGTVPFKGDSVDAIFHAILTAPAPSVRAANAQVPPELAALVAACLEKDKARRPPACAAVAERLQGLLQRYAPGAEVPPGHRACPRCGVVLPREGMACPLEKEDAAAPPPDAEPEPADGMHRLLEVAFGAPPPLEAAEERPLVAARFGVRPRHVRVGDRVTVECAIENPNVWDIAGAELAYVVPGGEGFALAESRGAWSGLVPARRADETLRIAYSFEARQAGVFPPVRVELCWPDAHGVRRTLLCGTIPPLHVRAVPPVPLIGRQEIRQAASRLLRGASRGETGVLVLRGESGAGKTFLCDYIAREAEGLGFAVAAGAASGDAGEALEPFLAAVRSHLEMGEAVLSEGEVHALIARYFGAEGDGATTAAFIADALLGQRPERDHGPPGEGTDQLAGYQPYRWYRVLTRMAATRPLLVVLENLHAADVAAVRLLAYVARRCRENGIRVLFCATYRPARGAEAARAAVQALEELAQADSASPSLVRAWSLPAFGADEVAEAIDAFFPGGKLAERVPWLPEALLMSTGGTPHFVAELLADLVRDAQQDGRFAVVRADSTWELGEGITPEWLRHHIPSGVESLVRVRTRHVRGDPAEILDVAAVIGEEFDTAVLGRVLTSLGAGTIEEGLDALEAEGLVRPITRKLTRYRFTHSMLHAAIERQVEARGLGRASRLHRAIAGALRELAQGAALGRGALEIGEHLLAAGDAEEALEALLDGLQYLLRQDLFYQCADPLARAKEAARALPEVPEAARARLLWVEAEWLRGIGQPERALGVYRAHVEAIAHAADALALANAWVKIGEVQFRLGRSEEAEASFMQALSYAQAAGDARALAGVHNSLGLIHKRRQRFDGACEHLARARDLFEEARDAQGAATARINLGNVRRLMGDYGGCAAALADAVALAKGAGARHIEAGAVLSLANLSLVRKEYDDAEARYRSALALYRAMGDRFFEATVLGNLAEVLKARGKIDDAFAAWRECVRLRRLLGNRPGEVRAFLEMTELLAAAGRGELAREEAEKTLAAAAKAGNRAAHAAALLVLARTSRRQDPSKARAYLADAVGVAREEGIQSLLDRAHAELLAPTLPEGAFLVETAELEALLGECRNGGLEVRTVAEAVDVFRTAGALGRDALRERVRAAAARIVGGAAREAWSAGAALSLLQAAAGADAALAAEVAAAREKVG